MKCPRSWIRQPLAWEDMPVALASSSQGFRSAAVQTEAREVPYAVLDVQLGAFFRRLL